MVIGEIPSFKKDITDILQKHKNAFSEFLGQGSKVVSVLGIFPSAFPFIHSICLHLETEFQLDTMLFTAINPEDENRLERSQIEGYRVIVIDGRGTKYPLVKKQIQSLQPFRILTVTWDDDRGIADIVLNPEWKEHALTVEMAAIALNIHPDTLSRLCREGKVSGARRLGKSWNISRADLQQFAKTYEPQRGRPKISS